MARKIKKPLSWYIIWVLISAITISLLAAFVLSLPIWQVKYIKVTGNEFIPEEKIINYAKIPLGDGTFHIDLDEIKSRFEKVIQIKEVKIKRKLPATIVINVDERRPFAIAIISNATTLIDDDGFIIAKQGLASSIYKIDIQKYPVVRGINVKSLENGRRLNEKDRFFIKNALGLLSRFVDIGSLQLDVGNREDITIYIEDIIKVKIGSPTEIERKTRIIQALLSSIQGKWPKVSYIDVRVPDSPVIRFK